MLLPMRQIWHFIHLDNLNYLPVGVPASSLTSFLYIHVCTAARVISKIKVSGVQGDLGRHRLESDL